MHIKDYPKRLPSADGDLWIMHVPVIATCHITVADMRRLEAGEDSLLLFPPSEDGYLLRIDGHIDPERQRFSAEFNALVQHFLALNYAYLRLDSAGDTIEGLPTFNW
jgi:hypothetical protein